MGENGSGKTSLAQAFTWCLYGKTDFDDPILLCKTISQTMVSNEESKVRVAIELVHSGTEYTIISEQDYTKSSDGKIKPLGQRKFNIVYKAEDGQQEFIPDLQTDLRMKEILPIELSKYFFFDGERIGNMSKDLKKGKSQEFAEAVRSLLGLNALINAMSHLKGKGASKSVLKRYDEMYDSTSDRRIAEYTSKIDQYDEDIERIENTLEDHERECERTDEKIRELNDRIRRNESSADLAKQRDSLISNQQQLITYKKTQVSDLLKSFNKIAPVYFTKRMMRNCLEQLSDDNKLTKSVPDIHARTIDQILKSGRCICGAEVIAGNSAYNELNSLLEFIPPKSLGNMIDQFRLTCESSVKASDTFYSDFKEKYSGILSFDATYNEYEEKITQITSKLRDMEDVGKLQSELTKYEKHKRDLTSSINDLNRSRGSNETNRERIESERKELTLKDKNNKQIEVYKAYAQYLYDVIYEQYTSEEERVRNELSTEINGIFRTIYNGGFSLSLDDKYNVQVLVDDYNGYKDDVETSTAQSISIIFAFIAGVIKMARKSHNSDGDSDSNILVSEPYPLVMDAPLSSFDKTRIQTVCTVLPEVAEQVVIFIKDTDGEIAEQYLNKRIGSRATFDKKNEFETHIVKGDTYNV
jgi:DNA sulfur modification protein DndD